MSSTAVERAGVLVRRVSPGVARSDRFLSEVSCAFSTFNRNKVRFGTHGRSGILKNGSKPSSKFAV